MHLTKNFTLEEMVYSDTAIRNNLDNVPGPDIINNLRDLCQHVLQPVRDNLGAEIIVSSGYRSPDVNAINGGAKNSQHLVGEAADIKCPTLGNAALYYAIADYGIFDQLIWEKGDNENPDWVHISYTTKRTNRKQKLRII